MIRVFVVGCCGSMGKEVVRAVTKEKDMCVCGGADVVNVGQDVGEIAGAGKLGVSVSKNLSSALKESRPDCLVDFTHVTAVMKSLQTALPMKIPCVVGTTGFDAKMLYTVKKLCAKHKTGCLIAPNFAVGAVLMMKFAEAAAKFLPDVEIIELHHNRKKDSPSGTAVMTAQKISSARKKSKAAKDPTEVEKIKNSRGGTLDDIHIHSVRLPGYVAHQEVIFGGIGQTLTLRHDSISRESFMPGVVLAVRKIKNMKGLVFGLENLLFDKISRVT